MATTVEPETIPWGERVSTHEAIPFYESPGWKALADGQKWAAEGKPEEGRHLAPSREVLEELVRTQTSLPRFWITTVTEEIFGLDTEGRTGAKNKAVMLTLHGNGIGGGIILQSPQSLQAAYTNRTPNGEPSVQQEKITAALSGILPNGQQIKVYTWNALMKEDPAKLPQVYAIAMPLDDLGGTPSGLIKVTSLPENRIYVARAGHQETAENHAKIVKNAGVREYGNWHSVANADPENNPSGRVLHAGNNHYDGLNGYDGINDGARFVGVRQLMGAGGAAPRKQANPLEGLTGKS